MPIADDKVTNRGFFTIAQSSDSCDYVRLAYGLALSLLKTQTMYPRLSIGITPGTKVDDRYAWAFDQIIEIPWGDHAKSSNWKLENEWKVIHMTPYDETIKLDADMLFFHDITSWWNVIATRDIVPCTRVVDYRGQTITSDFYRKVFTDNHLPNIYTGMMYFNKSDKVHDLFKLVKIIYFNWERFFEEFLLPDERPSYLSTDVIFALALKILDDDDGFHVEGLLPTFTHMKSRLQGWDNDPDDDWMVHIKPFFTEDCQCKIGNFQQFFPLHYHRKEFLTDEMIGYYERYFGH